MKYAVLGACLCILAAGSAEAKDGFKANGRGLNFRSGSFELNLGGRLHLDAASFDAPAASSNRDSAVALRRARLELSGRIGKAIQFRVDREFAGRSKGWRNLWVAVEPADNVSIKGGNFIVPFSAEDLQSSNTSPFVERSLMSALTPGFGLGASVSTHGKNWSASAGYFTDPLSNEEGRSSKRGNGTVARLTLTPLNGRKRIVHVGLAGERRTFKDSERLRFSADPGSTLAPTLMSTGAIGHLNNLSSFTGEASGAFGPVLVQGQFVVARVSRDGAENLHFNGQNLQASWLITGGRYDYSVSQGVFDGPVLRRDKGAVEAVARISRLDLNNGHIQRGTGQAVTGGLNWYINQNLRLMADYTASRVRVPATNSTIQDHVAVGRLQVAF